MKSYFRSLVLLIICTFLSANINTSHANPKETIRFISTKNKSLSHWKNIFQSGQILLTEAVDPLQLSTLLMYPEFSPFNHIGIVEVINGEVFVYHADTEIGKFISIEKPPSDTMRGTVIRSTLADFFQGNHAVSVYSIPSNFDIEKVLEFAKHHVRKKTPFDPYFDSYDHSKLYCTEFVGLALEFADRGYQIQRTSMRNNKSLQTIRNWMKVRDATYIFPYTITDPRNWAGTISLSYTEKEIMIDRVIKYELHKRFTQNQKIGNILEIGGFGVNLRPSVQRLYKKITANWENKTVTDKSLNALVQNVAETAREFYGSVNGEVSQPLPRCQLTPRVCAQ